MIAGATSSKPRVLFVRQKRIKNSADFFNDIQDEIVILLKMHFDVIIIEDDFDYGEACDSFTPNFVLFDSPGGNRPVLLSITNIASHPEIPRVAYTNQDPHDTIRVPFLRMMDEWGIDRFFTCNTSFLRQSPELANCAFVLPAFFNSDVFHDYGLEKIIPASVFGGLLMPKFYHWRYRTAIALPDCIPTLFYTHPGYDDPLPAQRYPISGTAYGQMISRSRFSLADTTRLDYLVRKHLEIPACGAVLVSPDTPEVGFYGFIDMHNCILGEGKDLFDKMAAAAANPDLYESIRRNGHDLVHSRYTYKNWTGIADWFSCQKSLRPGEVVQQQGVFGPFRAAAQCPSLPALNATFHDNEFTALIKKARADILQGNNLDEAKQSMLQIIDWTGHISEPWALLGLIEFLRGKLQEAKNAFLAIDTIHRQGGKPSNFDPEEIAWLSLIGAITGDQELLLLTRTKSEHMRHISLRRVQWMARVLAGGGDASSPPPDVQRRQPGDRLSIHWMGEVNLKDWLALINRILMANNMDASLKNG